MSIIATTDVAETRKITGNRPAATLAHAIHRHFGVQVTTEEVESFVRDNWRMVSLCAHAIRGH
jgi:hypothetical protein